MRYLVLFPTDPWRRTIPASAGDILRFAPRSWEWATGIGFAQEVHEHRLRTRRCVLELLEFFGRLQWWWAFSSSHYAVYGEWWGMLCKGKIDGNPVLYGNPNQRDTRSCHCQLDGGGEHHTHRILMYCEHQPSEENIPAEIDVTTSPDFIMDENGHLYVNSKLLTKIPSQDSEDQSSGT